MEELPSPNEMEKSNLPPSEQSALVRAAQDQFIHEWGRMSSSWGINRTMAQIHALLFISGQPLDMEEIMERLQISRGNASMNLRELMDWAIVRRFRHPGDRKDTYVSESDPLQMFLRVAKERKRREIDPTVEAIRDVLATISTPQATLDQSEAIESLRTRLQGLLEIFGLIDAACQQAFSVDVRLEDLKSRL